MIFTTYSRTLGIINLKTLTIEFLRNYDKDLSYAMNECLIKVKRKNEFILSTSLGFYFLKVYHDRKKPTLKIPNEKAYPNLEVQTVCPINSNILAILFPNRDYIVLYNRKLNK